MFGRVGPFELLLILAIVLVIFGPKKLPEIGSAIGKAIQSFREGLKKKADEGGRKGIADDDRSEGPNSDKS